MSTPKRFECNSCAYDFPVHTRHPTDPSLYIGHCERCCREEAREVYQCERFPLGVEFICANCCEAANENALSDYYGGSGPQTDDELCAAAWAEKMAAKG